MWYPLAGRLARMRSPMPPRDSTVRLPDGTLSPALVLPTPARRTKILMIVFAVMAVLAVYATYNPSVLGSWRWVGPIVPAVLAVVLVASLLGFLRGGGWRETENIVALTPSGLLVRVLGSAVFAPWEGILNISVKRISGLPGLGVEVRSGQIQRIGAPRTFGFLERPMNGHDLSIVTSGWPTSPEETTRLVLHYFEHPGDRVDLGNGSAQRIQEITAAS
jgi:hypothetical protein